MGYMTVPENQLPRILIVNNTDPKTRGDSEVAWKRVISGYGIYWNQSKNWHHYILHAIMINGRSWYEVLDSIQARLCLGYNIHASIT